MDAFARSCFSRNRTSERAFSPLEALVFAALVSPGRSENSTVAEAFTLTTELVALELMYSDVGK